MTAGRDRSDGLRSFKDPRALELRHCEPAMNVEAVGQFPFEQRGERAELQQVDSVR